MKIVTIVGARPQFIKAATISRVINSQKNIEEVMIHTGQHYDQKMSDVFFNELNIPIPDYNLGVGSFSHGKQTGLMLRGIEDVLLKEKPDWVLTFGDTNSTLAGALAASKLQIKTAHVEAGLRSFNRLMPEEINRIATDHISDLLFAPTQNALSILAKEGLEKRSVLVGDVMFDSILFYENLAKQNISINQITHLKEFYLATIHRPENTDSPEKLQNIFTAFSELDLPVLLPLHPRTKKNLEAIEYSSNVNIIEPVSYLEMIRLISASKKVLTDSGGLQKEAYFLKKPCITLREETEWVETLEGNWNFIVSSDKDKIIEKVSNQAYGVQRLVFGDGNAAEKIIDYIKTL